jgi:Fur family peroxide stress response transcriptional regulator
LKEHTKERAGKKRAAGKKSLRRTPQRLAIISYLEGNTSHPAAEDIFRELSPRFPTMSLSTVYNNLAVLEREGKVVELRVDPTRSRFDPNTEPHHHLVCLECGRVVDIFREFEIELSPEELAGFEVRRSEVSFFGLCPDCQARAEKDRGRQAQ